MFKVALPTFFGHLVVGVSFHPLGRRRVNIPQCEKKNFVFFFRVFLKKKLAYLMIMSGSNSNWGFRISILRLVFPNDKLY